MPSKCPFAPGGRGVRTARSVEKATVRSCSVTVRVAGRGRIASYLPTRLHPLSTSSAFSVPDVHSHPLLSTITYSNISLISLLTLPHHKNDFPDWEYEGWTILLAVAPYVPSQLGIAGRIMPSLIIPLIIALIIPLDVTINTGHIFYRHLRGLLSPQNIP